MSELPAAIEHHLVRRSLAERRSAYVLTDEAGTVRGSGGDLEWFGLADVASGNAIQERIAALQGFIPLVERGADVLPRIELVDGRSTDIHMGRSEEGAFLFFLDATREAERERHYQQKGNELSLMLRSIGVAVFEALADDRFRLLSLQPAWLRSLAGNGHDDWDLLERFPFLETFLEEAHEAWSPDGPRLAWSGIWVEEDERDREWHLEASATRLEDGRRLLIVQTQDRRYEERFRILQEARSRSLEFDRLRREIDKKEILLHCIVHDLKGPLSGMVGTMSLVKGRELAPDKIRELLEVGLESARHQEAMIKGILDAFSAEVENLQHFETDPANAPDLVECAQNAVATYRPAYDQNDVELALDVPSDSAHPKVAGEASRLERVLCNLMENALRHSPKKGVVRVGIEARGAAYRVSVVDRGPGVPEDVRASLFQKFSKGKKRGGAAGLGLYFCRSTVERWGGEIGYEDAPGGGSCFWFSLPAVS